MYASCHNTYRFKVPRLRRAVVSPFILDSVLLLVNPFLVSVGFCPSQQSCCGGVTTGHTDRKERKGAD